MTEPRASRSQASQAQPKDATSGPNTSAESATRPVTTTCDLFSAPKREAN